VRQAVLPKQPAWTPPSVLSPKFGE
jgi:hypothetical protein